MKLTEQEIEILKTHFNNKTLKEIMGLMPRQFTYKKFRALTNKLGFKRDVSKVKIPKTATYNLDYWKELNLVNCYLAGHIAADGCLMNGKQGNRLSVFAAIKDESMIDVYIKELNYKGKKDIRQNHGFGSKSGDYKCCRITFCSFDKNASYLKKYFNLEPRKTERLGPTNISNNYLNMCYLIGLLDGDGSVYSIPNNKIYKTVTVCLGSCSKGIIEWTRDLLFKQFPPSDYSNRVPSDLSFHKKNNIWSFGISGLRAAVIINYLRKFPVPKLARKWENPEVLAYIEDKKREHPELFIEPDPAELAALMPAPQEAAPQFSLPPL